MGEITGKSFVKIKESSVLFLHRNKCQVERIFKYHHNVPEENILNVLIILEIKYFLSMMKPRSQRENINKFYYKNF